MNGKERRKLNFIDFEKFRISVRVFGRDQHRHRTRRGRKRRQVSGFPPELFYVGETVAKDKHLSEIVYIKYEGLEQSMRLTSLHIGFGDRPMLKERK